MLEVDCLELLYHDIRYINQMEDILLEIKSNYKGQKNVKLHIWAAQYIDQECLLLLSKSEVSRSITHLKVHSVSFLPLTLDLDCFISLKSFKGVRLDIKVGQSHLVEELELHEGCINCIPVNL